MLTPGRFNVDIFQYFKGGIPESAIDWWRFNRANRGSFRFGLKSKFSITLGI